MTRIQNRPFDTTRTYDDQPVRARPAPQQPPSNDAVAAWGGNDSYRSINDTAHRWWPARADGDQSIPPRLRPNAARGARVARELGFNGTIYGRGQRSGPSDHPSGNAIDLMTNRDRAQGRRLAEHFRQNRDQLGVKYVIFEQMIASPRTNWEWRRMEDRGNPTANHMDHVHISFR